MTLLILGMVFWIGGHLYPRLSTGLKPERGSRLYTITAVVLLIALALLVIGFRSAPFIPVYTPLHGIGHLNNTLMLIAIFLFGVGKTKGRLSNKIRHPMLIGTIVFAVAHMLVNGDLASLVMFGGIGLWAIVEIFVINLAQGPWERPNPGNLKGDLVNLVVTIILYALIAAVHIWAGHNPFLGTYA